MIVADVEGVQRSSNFGRLRLTDPLENLLGLPELSSGIGGMTGGQCAATEASQRVGLVPRAVDLSGNG